MPSNVIDRPADVRSRQREHVRGRIDRAAVPWTNLQRCSTVPTGAARKYDDVDIRTRMHRWLTRDQSRAHPRVLLSRSIIARYDIIAIDRLCLAYEGRSLREARSTRDSSVDLSSYAPPPNRRRKPVRSGKLAENLRGTREDSSVMIYIITIICIGGAILCAMSLVRDVRSSRGSTCGSSSQAKRIRQYARRGRTAIDSAMTFFSVRNASRRQWRVARISVMLEERKRKRKRNEEKTRRE